MNHTQARRARPLVLRSAFRVSPVAAAVSSLLLSAGAVQAQQAGAEATQQVVITGIRRGIESSVSTKRNSDSIVEAVSSEDIGKLPDLSIAESLARLPGLAGQRVAGRAQVIAVRGLGPDFVATLLNGREQVTTSDNRSVEFDQFPSELLGSVVVYKTPDGSLVGQGLAATVDMRAMRPLDFGSRAVVLNARVEQNSHGSLNSNTSARGSRFSFSYVDQFADRTLGVALGLAHLDTPGQELHYKAWGFSANSPTRDCIVHPEWGCSPVTGLANDVTYLNGFEATAVSRKQKRDGAMAVLDWKPTKDIRSTLDLYYSKFKKDETMRGLMGGIGDAWGGATGAAFSNVQTERVGGNTTLVTSATVSGVPNMVVRNDLNTREDELRSAGWNTQARFGKFTAIADLSYSGAKREENVIETYAAYYTNATTKGLTTFRTTVPSGSGFPTLTPDLNFADAAHIKLSDPGGWGHDGLWKKPKAKDTINALRLEGRYDLDAVGLSRVDFGVNQSQRKKEREMNELAANLKNNRAPLTVPGDILQSPTSLGHVGINGVVAYDVMGGLNKYYDLVPQAVEQVSSRNYDVTEKVGTAFAKAGIDTSLFGLPLRGNLGVQFVHTDQSSNGTARSQVSGNWVFSPVHRGTTYNDVLPSLNLVAEVGANTALRLGASKTLARGRMDDMRAGAEVTVVADNSKPGGTKWTGNGGNTALEPWRADAYDLSVEHYFNKRSYVALAGFYKKLDTYIYTQKIATDFSSFKNVTALPTPLDPVGEFETPANGRGGRVTGTELTVSFDGSLVSAALDGIGIQASVSDNGSNLHPDGPDKPTKLPGLSRTVAALTVYYERDGFSARINQRYRSAFRGEISGLHNAREFTEILPDRQTDMQVSYEFTSGSLKGLSLLLQVNNLTNSPYATRQGNGFGDAIAPLEYNKYGRQTLFGVNYKL